MKAAECDKSVCSQGRRGRRVSVRVVVVQPTAKDGGDDRAG